MEYAPEEYTRHYIVQALFKLMGEYEYEKISVTDVVAKAGVGRATFYRNFKNKEAVLLYYLEHNTREFVFSQKFYPRCKADHIRIVIDAFTLFEKNKEQFRLIRRARLEYIYLDFLNKNFKKMFGDEYPEKNAYTPYLYAGMLFNVSMAWLDDGMTEPKEKLAELIVNTIYFEQ